MSMFVWSLVLILLIFTPGNSVNASDYFHGSEIKNILGSLKSTKNIKKLPQSSPDYPIQKTLEALVYEKSNQPLKVIETLEFVLVKKNFDGKKESYKLSVDALGSFSLWRETMYLTLARAYYQIGNYATAELFFEGIPHESTYYKHSLLGLTWTHLAQEKYDEARVDLSRLSELVKSLKKHEKNEKLVQESYLALITGNIENAIALGNRYRGSTKTLVGISRSKVLAQAYFEKYLKTAPSISFTQKKYLLGKVIQLSESVPMSYRDAAFAFFGGEAYWHMASVYRIKNPEKYLMLTQKYLSQSGLWLEPWVKKSLKSKKAHLVEDAWFFSIALLWEQDRFKEAIPRLIQAEKLYPQGEYRQDAYQLLADYFYEVGNFKSSIQYYRKLAQSGNAEKSAYGVYKAAWSFYNLEDKWAALRHLERLLFFYHEEAQNANDLPAGNLAKEVRKDMLVVLAELMPSSKALRELRILNLAEDEWLGIQEDLASIYLKIGKYEEAVSVWKKLLVRYSQHEKSFGWLEGVLKAQLASGLRNSIATTITKYFAKLPSENDYAKKHAQFQKAVVGIALTIHKESRKTNDPDIWRATDRIYTALVKLYPNHQQGDIWYYGAQRKESLKKLGEAIEWYQKAAMIDKYANAKDAAYSILRIAKDFADSESLKKERSKKNYQRLVKATQWYIQNFKNTKQRGLAEFLLLEAYLYLGEFSKANLFLANAFSTEGPTKEHKNQYFSHNRLLYKYKNWKQAHLAANAVSTALVKKSGVFFQKVKKLEQETAFQAGYEIEKRNKKEARKWYQKSLAAGSDHVVSLKAWNNLFSAFELPKEQAEFFDAFGEFEDNVNLKFIKNKSNRKLVFNVFRKAVENAEKASMINEKIDLIFKASKFTSGNESSELRWDALNLAGTYYNLPQMNNILSRMQRLDRKFIYAGDKRLTIARLYFWNGNYSQAFRRVKSILRKKERPAGAWILMRDLYAVTQASGSDVGEMIKDYFIENHENLKKEPLLQPIWASLLYPDFGSEQIVQWETVGLRKIASLSPKTKNGPAHVQLKARLDEVGKTLRELEKSESKIKEFLDSPAPQVTVAALCIVPRFRFEAVRRLKKLETPTIRSKQWNGFLKRLRMKSKELSRIASKEEKICEQQKRIIAFMPPLVKSPSPLCNGTQCFPMKPTSMQKLITLRKKNPKGMKGKLDLVNEILELGGWAIAEEYAYSVKVIAEREILLGFLRIAIGDSWNAVPLLNAAKKSRYAEPHARLFLSRILWRHGNRELASNELRGVKSKNLIEWEKDLFIELSTDLRRSRR